MKRWEEQIVINAPATTIYDYVSDFARHSEWGGHGLQATQIGSGPVVIGTKFATTAKHFGTQREESTITEAESPKKFGWDSVGALGRIHHWFALQESGGSTTLVKGAEIVAPKFLAKMTMFKVSKDLPKGLRSDLDKIKANIEAR
jgi:uncharacterized membrane protein